VPVRNPSPLLDRLADHLPDACGMADFVLVDAPPLLTTSDGAELARHADGVLLVVRSGKTSVGAGARSVELLERLSVPIIGAVLIGSDGAWA
jgi:Mrp family chromosome partitioning ATPase